MTASSARPSTAISVRSAPAPATSAASSPSRLWMIYTVKFTLSAPNAAFMAGHDLQLRRDRPAVRSSRRTAAACPPSIPCAAPGPFKYSESVVDNHITLVKNEDYWKENAPKLDGIHLLSARRRERTPCRSAHRRYQPLLPERDEPCRRRARRQHQGHLLSV